LKFKDQSGCDTIITQIYIIQNLGAITIDTSQITVSSSQCAYASGTITGINVQGATNYQWINSSGQTVSNSLIPGFVYSGAYVLVASTNWVYKTNRFLSCADLSIFFLYNIVAGTGTTGSV
jgi:hypothetical protein